MATNRRSSSTGCVKKWWRGTKGQRGSGEERLRCTKERLGALKDHIKTLKGWEALIS